MLTSWRTFLSSSGSSSSMVYCRPSISTRVKPSLRDVLQRLLVPPLLPPHQRRPDGELRAQLEAEDLIDDLLLGLPLDRPPADPAVRMADARVEQTQVVVHLGDRAHGGARVAGGGLLVDGDGRREPLDGVDVGLVHLPQELARVRRQALDVAPLPFGVDGVEGEARFPRARQAGDDDETVAREPEGDVLEVVLPGAEDDYLVGAHEGGF